MGGGGGSGGGGGGTGSAIILSGDCQGPSNNNVNVQASGNFLIVGTGTSPGAGAGSEHFGAGSLAAGASGSAFGPSASAAGASSIAVGASALAGSGAPNAIAIGASSDAAGTGSVSIGQGSAATGGNGGVALGQAATASGGNGGVAVGQSATTTAANALALGASAAASIADGIAIGFSASALSVGGAIAIGDGAVATGIALGAGATDNAGADPTGSSIAIGSNATVTAGNQCVFGGASFPINDIYAGLGVTSAAPSAWTLHGTGGSGTNIAGAGLNLAAGRGTGNTKGGIVSIETSKAGSSGTTLNALVNIAQFTGDPLVSLLAQTHIQSVPNDVTPLLVDKPSGGTQALFQIQASNGVPYFQISPGGNINVLGGNTAGTNRILGTSTGVVSFPDGLTVNQIPSAADTTTILFMNTAATPFAIYCGTATHVPFTIRAASGQTADLLDILDGNGRMLWAMNASGNIQYSRVSSLPASRPVADLIAEFAVSTDATRQGRMRLVAEGFNGAASEGFRVEGDGSAAGTKISHFGVTAVVRTAAYTVTNPVNTRSYDTTTVTLTQLAQVVSQIIGDLQSYGLFQ